MQIALVRNINEAQVFTQTEAFKFARAHNLFAMSSTRGWVVTGRDECGTVDGFVGQEAR